MHRFLLMMLIISMLLLTGCGNNKAQNDNANEVIFWTMQLSPTFDDYFKKAIAEFEKEHPGVKIKWVDVPYNDMENKVMATVASGGFPDVINLHPQLTKILSQYDMLLDMDERAADVKNEYLKSAWLASSVQGKARALPWYLATALTYYNKDIMLAAGLRDMVPKSYDDALVIARAVKERTGKYGMTFPFADIEMIGHFQKLDPNLFNSDYTKINLHSPMFLQAAKYFRILYQEGLVPKDSLTNNNSDEIKMYSAGEIALFESGTSSIRNIKENSESVYNTTKVAPLLSGAAGDDTEIAVMNIAVSAKSKKQEMALLFAKFITNPENQLEFCKLAGAVIPSTKSSLDAAFFKDGDGTPIGEARRVSTIEVKRDMFKVLPLDNWMVMKDEFVPALQKYISADTDDPAVFLPAEEKINQSLQEKSVK